jgi:phosphatidylinositol alpha-1,6-mannosyltransferase
LPSSPQLAKLGRVIAGLFPELDAPGGIQLAGRHIAAVMNAFARERSLRCQFLSLNDPLGTHSLSAAGEEISFRGFGRSKTKFAAAATRAAWRGARVVLAAHPNLAPVVLAMKVVRPRLRSIICMHGVEVWKPLGAFRRWSLRRANVILAPSMDTAERAARAQKLSSAKIRRVPWALDPQFAARVAASRAQTALPAGYPGGRVILSVGRWNSSERYKGMDHLIAALPRLLTDFPEVHLVAVGDGDDRGWLENLAEGNGVARHVHFVRGLSQEELGAWYSACEVFALPSRGEGFGLVYLEAMAYGKPVVAGAHGGAPEIVEDGVTGYVVPHGDLPQLATALAALLSDTELRQKMGARGQARVQREFLFAKFSKSLKKILREQCGS